MPALRSRVLNFILVFALTSLFADSRPICPDFVTSSSDQYTTYGSSCYVLKLERLTWQDADSYCKNSAPNGRLAKVESSSLINELSSVLGFSFSTSRKWIGGYSPVFGGRNNSKSNWYWSSYKAWPFSDENITTSLWAFNQPQFGNFRCMSISSYYLYADDCSELQSFLCAYDCIEILKTNGTDAVITSPGFPSSNYPAYTRCEWFIDVIKPTAVLELESFSTERSYDFLSIKEMRNSSSAIQIFSGYTYPQTITSPSQYMYLLFYADGGVQYSGFSLSVHSKADVPVKRLTGHGVLTSESFPSNYTNNMTTKWLLSVANGTIVLNFTDFSLQPGQSGNCTYDRLLIKEGGAEGRIIGIFCGEQMPQNVTSASGVLYLQMDTDSMTSSKGFRAVFHRIEDQCVHVISSSFGNITSPGYPLNYPPNLKCAWYIDTHDGVAILKFSNFSLYYDFYGYCGDQVEVYGGYLNNETQLMTSCSSLWQTRLTSASRYITVYMRTNQYYSSTGFTAIFRSSTNCSYVYRQESGVVTSPDYPSYYDPYTNCSWLIDVINGTAILQFTGLNMFNSSECTTDSIEVYDGNSPKSPLIRRLCKMMKPITLNATSQFLFIRMKTGSYSYGNGFTAIFYSSNNDCPSLTSNEFYTEHLSWNGNCYGLSKSEYRWEAGRDTCERLGASLLFIESAEELNAISGWLSQSFSFIPSIWTGAFRRRAGSSSWHWSTNTGDLVINDGISSLFTGEDTPLTYSAFLMEDTLYLVSNLYSIYQVMCKVKSRKHTPNDPPKAPCSAPFNIHSGYYTPTQMTFPSGSHVNYYCENGYQLSGNGTFVCQNGFWNGALPKCLSNDFSEEERSKCSPPPTSQYMIYKPVRPVYNDGASLNFACRGRYSLTSNSSIICLNGFWQGTLPSCTEITTSVTYSIEKTTKEKPANLECHQPEIEHASYFPSTKTYTNGSAILVFCIVAGVRSVSGNLTCMNGVWSGKSPTCYDEKTISSKNLGGQIPKPESHSSQGIDGNKSVVLPVTVTLIVVLAVVIIGGVIFFVIYRRRANPPRALVEMQ